MNNLTKQFPVADKKQVRRESFSLNAVIWSMVCGIILVVLTMAGVFDPTFSFIDMMFENWKVQLGSVLTLCLVVAGWWIWRRL